MNWTFLKKFKTVLFNYYFATTTTIVYIESQYIVMEVDMSEMPSSKTVNGINKMSFIIYKF